MEILNNPPIVAAFCQIKYDRDAEILTMVDSVANGLGEQYPIRTDHFSAQIGGLDEVMKKGVGETSFRATSKSQLNRVEFRTKDQKRKLIISEDFVFISDENKYTSWQDFRRTISSLLEILSPLLYNRNIVRLSLRYVNRFVFDEFGNPSDYFKTMVTSSDDYNNDGELFKYGFRLVSQYPSTNMVSNVNHSLDVDPFNKYNYILDIDVLDHSMLIYNIDTVMHNFDGINAKLADIFFNTITDKTKKLCN